MLDKTITNALLQLRAHIVRGNLDGREHVEALLIARGVVLPHVPRPMPADRFRKSGLRLLLMDGLRGGPARSAVLIDMVMQRQPDLSRTDAMHRVHNVLWKMLAAGTVAKGDRDHIGQHVWRLSQGDSDSGHAKPYKI